MIIVMTMTENKLVANNPNLVAVPDKVLRIIYGYTNDSFCAHTF